LKRKELGFSINGRIVGFLNTIENEIAVQFENNKLEGNIRLLLPINEIISSHVLVLYRTGEIFIATTFNNNRD
jgi:hypothetical protein